jgi:hypothetical protein
MSLCGLYYSGSDDSCDYGNESSGSAKYVEFIEYVSDWWLPKNGLVPWS